MDRSTAKYFGFYKNLDLSIQDDYVCPEYDIQVNDLDSVLSEVFSVDPVSGFPKGDLAYWLSPDGNPMVKQWLENNLLHPRAVSSGFSMEGVTDDLIEEMSRKVGESVVDYQSRLSKIYEEAVNNYNDLSNRNNV